METTLLAAAEAAAEWWAAKMQQPFNQDNGTSNEPNGGTMFMLMNLAGATAQKGITPAKVENFKAALIRSIVEGTQNSRRVFGVDYHPDQILAEACEAAGIATGALPCKTHMWIDAATFKVTASFGYGAEAKIVYPLN